MTASREEVLACARPCDHAAHLYVNDESLLEAVRVFAAAALERGEAVVLVATGDHLRAMIERLEHGGIDCGALLSCGQLVQVEAFEALARIMIGERPSRAAFDSVVRPLIVRARDRFAGVAVFGELVNILWQENNRGAAHVLEEWWNELIAEYGFSLLCGYRVDPFDFQESVQHGIDAICATHTHLVPVAEYDRLERAVDEAMRQVFHNGDAAALKRHLLDRCDRPAKMPPALAAMLALRDILPSLAQDVRMIARENYRCGAAVAKS